MSATTEDRSLGVQQVSGALPEEAKALSGPMLSILGKAVDYIWDKATGKPDVEELNRRLSQILWVVFR